MAEEEDQNTRPLEEQLLSDSDRTRSATLEVDSSGNKQASKIDDLVKEEVNWMRLEHIGLIYSSALIGVFAGTMNSQSAFIYAVFSRLLEMPSDQVYSTTQIISLWWSFKLFFGALSEYVFGISLFGPHRQ